MACLRGKRCSTLLERTSDVQFLDGLLVLVCTPSPTSLQDLPQERRKLTVVWQTKPPQHPIRSSHTGEGACCHQQSRPLLSFLLQTGAPCYKKNLMNYPPTAVLGLCWPRPAACPEFLHGQTRSVLRGQVVAVLNCCHRRPRTGTWSTCLQRWRYPCVEALPAAQRRSWASFRRPRALCCSTPRCSRFVTPHVMTSSSGSFKASRQGPVRRCVHGALAVAVAEVEPDGVWAPQGPRAPSWRPRTGSTASGAPAEVANSARVPEEALQVHLALHVPWRSLDGALQLALSSVRAAAGKSF